MSRQDVIRGLDELFGSGSAGTQGWAAAYAYTTPVRELVAKDSPVYNNADLNGLLQKTFGDRTLTFENYKTLYRAMELNGLSGQVMLNVLCEYAVNNHKAKNRVPLRYITPSRKKLGKVTAWRRWQTRESKSIKLLEESSAEAVLRLLGIRRLPTQGGVRSCSACGRRSGAFLWRRSSAAYPRHPGAQYPTMKYCQTAC